MGNDLISRQAAIEALDCINGTEEVLRSLPSAQPERKRGKWIKGANHGLGVYTLTCDKCGYVDVSSNVINYCPNCGSYNGGDDNA